MSILSEAWAWLTDPANWTGDEGIPTLLAQHLRISIIAILAAMILTMPLAIWLGHIRRGGSFASSVGNIGRAIPTLGLLVMFAVSPIGISNLAVILALTAFAIPPILTNTYVAVRDVDDDLRDAAKGVGMTSGQSVRKVEIPMAMPVIAAGLRTAVVQVVATASLGAFIGAGTLGQPVVTGFGLQDNGELFGGAFLIASLCVLVELLMAFVQRVLTPKAFRRGRGRAMMRARNQTTLVENTESDLVLR